MNMENITDQLLTMKKREAEVVFLLSKKGGVWITNPVGHTCSGLAGIMGLAYSHMNLILKGMLGKGYLMKISSSMADKKSVFYAISSVDVLRHALDILEYKESPRMTKCEICNVEYPNIYAHCPECAKKEIGYILSAKFEEGPSQKSQPASAEKSEENKPMQDTTTTMAKQDITTAIAKKNNLDISIFGSRDIIPFTPKENAIMEYMSQIQIYSDEPRERSRTVEIQIKCPDAHEFSEYQQKRMLATIPAGSKPIWARTNINAMTLSTISSKSRKKKQLEADKFLAWCKTQNFSDVEKLCLDIILSEDHTYLNPEPFWRERIRILIYSDRTAVAALFSSKKKDEYISAMLYDMTHEVIQRYVIYQYQEKAR